MELYVKKNNVHSHFSLSLGFYIQFYRLRNHSLVAGTTVNIPWMCLLDNNQPRSLLDNNQPRSKSNITQKPQQKTQKSLVEALNNVCDILLSQLPKLCFKGERLKTSIPEEEYLAGLGTCKHNIHGRIIQSKGSTPLTVVTQRDKLKLHWKKLKQMGCDVTRKKVLRIHLFNY